MLDTLKNVDPATAAGLLSSLTLSVVPDERDHTHLAWDPLARAVLQEARRRLHLEEDDWSTSARVRVANLLGDELRHTLLTRERATAARQRLGASGALWTRAYRIEFTTDSKAGRVRPVNIEDAVRNPDAFQHLPPGPDTSSSNKFLSLFVKRASAREGEPSFTLVQAHRDQDVQRVEAAWRIYPSEVDIKEAREPLDILKAFVARYGLDLKIGGGEVRKFTLYERVPIAPGWNRGLIQVLGRPQSVWNAFWARAQDTYLEVALAYAIALDDYYATLEKHGVSR
jgi:hypothetical protein